MAIARRQRGSFFRGSELLRMLTMVVMLGVMGMLIFELRSPATARWLDRTLGNQEEEPAETSLAARSATKKTAVDKSQREVQAVESVSTTIPPIVPQMATPELIAATKPDVPVEPKKPSPEAVPKIIAGTDLDPDERQEADLNFAPITDRTEFMAGIEVNGYARLFHWIDNQSLDILRQRAKKARPFRDYVMLPDQHRGELLRLDMRISAILVNPMADVEQFSQMGIPQIYEIWGSTEQSQSFLYCCVTSELPPGLKPGSNLQIHAKFYGYFFKVQGYYSGKVSPKSKPLVAPLIVGRLDWTPPQPLPAQSTDWLAASIGGIVFVFAVGGVFVYRSFLRSRPVWRPGSLPTPEESDKHFATFIDQGFSAGEAGTNSIPLPAHPSQEMWPPSFTERGSTGQDQVGS